MTGLPFVKMSGAGNDFVLVEKSRLGRSARLADLARRLCDRRAGVGADGLLVVGRGRDLPRLDYLNADGSVAFCGNGSRCAAWWMYGQGWTKRGRDFSFFTSEGVLRARVAGRELVSIRMPEPHSTRLGLKVKALGKNLRVHAINTGVPHVVVEVKNLDKTPVFQMGRALRRHPAFGPAGANVNFVRYGKGRAHVRTYERGVEDETLACGTGATATALVGHLLGKCQPPVKVTVKGGAALTVTFKALGQAFRDVWLQGPAKAVFTGKAAL